MFALRVPAFTIAGQSRFETYTGGLVSLAVVIVTFLFAILKLQHLINHKNPLVNTIIDKNAVSNEEKFEFAKQPDFMMAFALERTTTNERLEDPHFVKWFAEHWSSQDSIMTKKAIKMHKCTPQDFEKFYEPNVKSINRFTQFKENGGLYCIDWEEADIAVWGSRSSGNFGALDIMAVPCHMGMLVSPIDTPDGLGVWEEPDPECNQDRDKALQYMNNLRLIIVHNEGRFESQQFG